MDDGYRMISLSLEIDRSIRYLRSGLAEIQKISAINDFYDPVFIYLSGGFERLFKSMLCLNFLELNDRLPNANEIWNNKNGHDIEFLKSKVENICIPLEIPMASMDYDIITNDDFINNVCQNLSMFARRARYFNLDTVLGVDQNFDSQVEWEKMEDTILIEIYGEHNFFQLLADHSNLEKMYMVANKEIVIRLEKFFRALTRQFIFGNFSSNSIRYSYQIDDFAKITDEQHGNTDYSQYPIYKRVKRED